jgi:multiple sugar transport system ATP-binding protein
VHEQLDQLERDLDGESMRSQLVVSLDGSSRVAEGDDAEIWVDDRQMHLFDPATGLNLTLDEEAAGTYDLEGISKAQEIGEVQDDS